MLAQFSQAQSVLPFCRYHESSHAGLQWQRNVLKLTRLAVKVLVMNSCRILAFLAIALAGCRQATTPPATPRQALHVCNWHYVSKEDFAADIQSAIDAQITEQELDAQFAEFLDEVEAVQLEQIDELRKLIREHSLKHVWLEGLSESRMSDFQELVRQTKAIENENLPKANAELSKVRELLATFESGSPEAGEAREVEARLVALVQEQRERRLRIGAAGLLYMKGELERIMPLEDEAAFAKANPVTSEGTVVFDDAANDARQDAIAKRIIDAHEQVSLIVLGGGHKLDENLWRLSKGTVYCQRIELPTWKMLMEKHGQ